MLSHNIFCFSFQNHPLSEKTYHPSPPLTTPKGSLKLNKSQDMKNFQQSQVHSFDQKILIKTTLLGFTRAPSNPIRPKTSIIIIIIRWTKLIDRLRNDLRSSGTDCKLFI